MDIQKIDTKAILGVGLILSPAFFLFTMLAIYISLSFLFSKQANHIAYLSGPLVGVVFSFFLWILAFLVFIGIPSGIVLIFLSFRKKKR